MNIGATSPSRQLSSYLHFTAASAIGFSIVDGAHFASMATQRISVSFWGRAEAIEPFRAITWGIERQPVFPGCLVR
jgi:hypothetical protein